MSETTRITGKDTTVNNADKKPALRQTMSNLHTWVGLLPGWILYFMFITGTAGYFNTEITEWMKPEIPYAGERSNQVAMLTMAEKRLYEVAPHADEWYIGFPDDRNRFLRIQWEKDFTAAEKEKLLEGGLTEEQVKAKQAALEGDEKLYPKTGRPMQFNEGVEEARETGGGNKLYVMHYVLQYLPSQVALYAVIFCTLFMLVAIITGIVVHKKIFKDFFTFRPGKQQRSWLDSHNIFSVLTLPFQLMITYSGLLFFFNSILPLIMIAPMALSGLDVGNAMTTMNNGGEITDMSAKNQTIVGVIMEQQGVLEPLKPAGVSAPMIALSLPLSDVRKRTDNKEIQYVKVENRNDINGVVEFNYPLSVGGESGHYIYSAVNGELTQLPKENSAGGTAQEVNNVMINLHEGRFAPIVLRWIYFLTGLMGAGMIATGTILWSVKRRLRFEKSLSENPVSPGKGLILVEQLNVGTVVGLPVAVAVYFWANRLIPAGLELRADWEVHAMFIAWGLMFVLAMYRPRYKMWSDMLWLASAAYGLIPLLNLLTTERHLGISIMQGDWVMAGFDLTMLMFGVLFALAAKRVEKSQTVIESEQGELGRKKAKPDVILQSSRVAAS